MPNSYGATPATAQPTALDDATLAAVGRLIRAFSEFEEILTLFICALAELTPSQGLIVLGRAQFARRLAMAESLASLAGDSRLDKFKACFDTPQFKDAHMCRNAMAHGILLGKDEHGMLAFLTDKTEGFDGASTVQIVLSYKPETIIAWSKWADGKVEEFAKTLGLLTLLKRYRPQSLRPHRKGRIAKGSGGK